MSASGFSILLLHAWEDVKLMWQVDEQVIKQTVARLKQLTN